MAKNAEVRDARRLPLFPLAAFAEPSGFDTIQP